MNADKWDENYNGFNFPGFYDFIIDFFRGRSHRRGEEEGEGALEVVGQVRAPLSFSSSTTPTNMLYQANLSQLFPGQQHNHRQSLAR